jgi:hypothetical protein
MNSDGLFCICEISHNTLREYIEGMTKENFIGGWPDDVNLHVEGEAVKSERNISRETEWVIDCSVHWQHMEYDVWIIANA